MAMFVDDVIAAQAVFAYDEDGEGDLPLRVGDIVIVTAEEGEWWTGRMYEDTGRLPGLFPSNYVEVIAETDLPKKAVAKKKAAPKVGAKKKGARPHHPPDVAKGAADEAPCQRPVSTCPRWSARSARSAPSLYLDADVARVYACVCVFSTLS